MHLNCLENQGEIERAKGEEQFFVIASFVGQNAW